VAFKVGRVTVTLPILFVIKDRRVKRILDKCIPTSAPHTRNKAGAGDENL